MPSRRRIPRPASSSAPAALHAFRGRYRDRNIRARPAAVLPGMLFMAEPIAEMRAGANLPMPAHMPLRDARQPFGRARRVAHDVGLAQSAMKPSFSSVMSRLIRSPSRTNSRASGTPWQTTSLIEQFKTNWKPYWPCCRTGSQIDRDIAFDQIVDLHGRHADEVEFIEHFEHRGEQSARCAHQYVLVGRLDHSKPPRVGRYRSRPPKPARAGLSR